MASADFLKLTDLIYLKKWRISGRKFTIENNGASAVVTLTNDGDQVVLSSSEPDFLQYMFQVQEIVSGKGRSRLGKIRDSEKYWTDVEKLDDPNGEKVASAVESIVKGRFKLEFDAYKGIKKLLLEKVPQNDSDVLGVKEYYHEVLAHVLLESRQLLSIKEGPSRTNPVYASYASLYEQILRKGFFQSEEKSDPYVAYIGYSELIRLDLGDLLRRISEQTTYTEFLRNLLVQAGAKVEPKHGVRAVLDAYWRMCELCYPFLDTARIAIQLASGKTPSTDEPSFDAIVTFLANDSMGKKLVECVEPVLRHSEAHCAAGVIVEKGERFVVAYESRSYPAREIQRFTYDQVRDKTDCLRNSAVLAFYNTLLLFEYAFLILVLNSYEFKLRLVTLGQT